jgi:hypothetical protein
MTIRIAGVLIAALLYGSAAGAQTNSELLQKAIYTHDTVGDVGAAIGMYQQVIAKAPPSSDLRTQARRRLAVAKEQLSNQILQRAEHTGLPGLPRSLPLPVTNALGTVVDGLYRNSWTGLTLQVPVGWRVDGTSYSSDNGEMATLSAGESNVYVAVWMKMEKNDLGSIDKKLNDSPLQKANSRLGAGYQGYRLREGSVERVTLAGQQATVAIADYVEGDSKRPMAEYMTWIFSENTHIFFFSRLPADKLDQLKPEFDMMVSSAIVP